MISLSYRASRVALLLLFFIVNCLAVSAQKEPAIWYFGINNGIDFRSGAPVAITNPNISLYGAENKGVATVTDANGDLLFYYAEGETVYNRNHDIMLNGTGLQGSWASEQSGLTIRAIHDTTLYYLFTTDYEAGPNGMQYSIIDMKEDNGLGAVTTKNVRLFNNTTTQLCAVRHCNERDIWVVSHEWNSDAYYAFLVTPNGVSTTPVISHSGRQVVPGHWGMANSYGSMKASPDGKKIAASYMMMGADLSDFDNSTGTVSNSIDLRLMTAWMATASGVEFSPDSRLLYADYRDYDRNFIYQYNVYAGSPAAIFTTRTQIASVVFHGYYGGIQKGPDDKLYVAAYNQPHVSIIHNPNVIGTGCNYEWQGLLFSYLSSRSFPAYMETKFYPPTEFTFTIGCPAEKVSFEYVKPSNVTSVKWDFGDPASGTANTSTALDPSHEYTAKGTYLVKLIRFIGCGSDTLEKYVSVNKFSVDLGNDTAVCTNTGYLLNPTVDNTFDLLWQDGSTNNTLLASASNLYWLEITDPVSGCSARDTIVLGIQAQPEFTLGPDQQVCEAATQLATPISGSSYLWNDGSSLGVIPIYTSGLYWLQVNNGNCFHRDSVEITFKELSVNIGPDTTICENVALILDAGNPAFDYTWQDGSKNKSFAVNTTGLYIVTASYGNCIVKDSVRVSYNKKPVLNLGEDKQICGGETVILGSHLQNIYSYVWEDGSTAAIRKIYQAGTFRLTATNECGTESDEVVVSPGNCTLAVPNAFTPDGDGKNDVFSISKTSMLPSFSMQVFNRWGQKIFETRDQSQGWNGTLGGQLCATGNYAYVIQYRTIDGAPVMLKGMVLLLR